MSHLSNNENEPGTLSGTGEEGAENGKQMGPWAREPHVSCNGRQEGEAMQGSPRAMTRKGLTKGNDIQVRFAK